MRKIVKQEIDNLTDDQVISLWVFIQYLKGNPTQREMEQMTQILYENRKPQPEG